LRSESRGRRRPRPRPTTNLADAQQRLDEILTGQNPPREVNVRGLVLTDQQAKDFFITGGTNDFSSFVNRIQQQPGSEVKFLGTVNGRPFEAKVEPGEVKVQGLNLSQADFDTLVKQLQGQSTREFKVQAVVDGKTVIAKFENGQLRIRADNAGRDKSRVERNDRSGRSDRSDRPDRVERTDRPDRSDRVERTERADRVERLDRSGRH